MNEEQVIDKVSMIDQWKVSGDSYTQGELDAIGQLLELYYDNKKELEQEKEKNNNLIKQLQEQNTEIQDISRQLRQEKEKNKELQKYEEAYKLLSYGLNNYISKDKLKFILSKLNISDIEPWSTYKIDGQILFDLQELL